MIQNLETQLEIVEQRLERLAKEKKKALDNHEETGEIQRAIIAEHGIKKSIEELLNPEEGFDIFNLYQKFY